MDAVVFLFPTAYLNQANLGYNTPFAVKLDWNCNQESPVSPTILNIIVAVTALVLLYGFWVGVHLYARHRMGIRQIGCRGPVTDDFGNEVCCHTGEPCTGETEDCNDGESVQSGAR
jgi:hypothetical protein